MTLHRRIDGAALFLRRVCDVPTPFLPVFYVIKLAYFLDIVRSHEPNKRRQFGTYKDTKKATSPGEYIMIRFFDPFQNPNTLRRELDSIAGFLRNQFVPGHPQFLRPAAPQVARVNLAEDGDNIRVEMLAPGLDQEKIDISVLNDQLTISGEKKDALADVPGEKALRNERPKGRFTRTFTLPSEVNPDQVTAEYQNGVLKLNLPRAESAKPKKISVNVG